MKKKIYAGFLSIGLVVGMSACGGSDGGSDADSSVTDTTVIETNTTDTSEATSTVKGSPYLNKIGENGQVLSADATSWNMVELIEEGLLVDNPSYITSLKTYTHDEAKSYCENLTDGGYSDFRLPTKDELELLLKVSVLSSTEMDYFINYFSDSESNSAKSSYYSIWTSTPTSTWDGPLYVLYVDYKGNVKSYSISASHKAKAFCVRKW